MRTVTKYFYELEDGREVELPFNPDGEDITEVRREDEILLGCLVQDADAGDPLEEFDDGELVHFNQRYIRSGHRPDPGDFEEILRANPGHVFYVDSYSGGRYGVSHLALIKNATDIEDADGYYIAPADLERGKRALRYAKGVMEQYSAWAEGDVWGVCVWTYDAETLELENRDEVWGYYGTDYAEAELKKQLGG